LSLLLECQQHLLHCRSIEMCQLRRVLLWTWFFSSLVKYFKI
jgi:hypothetical protein